MKLIQSSIGTSSHGMLSTSALGSYTSVPTNFTNRSMRRKVDKDPNCRPISIVVNTSTVLTIPSIKLEYARVCSSMNKSCGMQTTSLPPSYLNSIIFVLPSNSVCFILLVSGSFIFFQCATNCARPFFSVSFEHLFFLYLKFFKENTKIQINQTQHKS